METNDHMINNTKTKEKTLLKKTIKKILVFLNVDMLLWNKIETVKNIFKYRKILEKNIASILEYKKKFDYEIFIETGTHKGNMVQAMKNRFKKIYSIELGDELYKKTKERFINDNHIVLFKGDSGIILPEILKIIGAPAIFWLDAHYSEGDTARGEIDTPIELELSAIFNHPIKNHVIMIDDARCFNGKDGYPTAGKIEKMAISHNYLFEMKNDNFRLYPKN